MVPQEATTTTGSYAKGFRIQRSVIGALLMRELHTRYGRDNVGYIWLILEPMILATVVSLMHSHATQFASDIKPVPVAILGYCNFMVFRSIFNRSEGAMEGNMPLLYHRKISVFDILFSRAVLDAAGSWMAFFILMGLAIALGYADLPERPLYLLAGMLSLFLFSFALSLVMASLTHENRALGRLMHPVSYFMLPIGGVFFPMQIVPEPLRDILGYVPLTHMFELLRYGQFRAATLDYVDFFYLAGSIALPMLCGLFLVGLLRDRLEGA
jgi:capsular polysaccharide transport system permease protein